MTQLLLAYTSIRRRERQPLTLGRIWRWCVATAKASWKRMLVFAAMGFVLSFVFNAYIMGKKYDGFRSPNRVAPVTGKGSTLVGVVFWFAFTTILFAVVGYRMKVGKERFWAAVREFPQTVRALVTREPDAALTRILSGFAGALVIMLLIGPSLTAVFAGGVLLFVASALRPVLAALVGWLWHALLGKFLTMPQPGPAALAAGSAGAVVAAMTGMVFEGTGVRLVLAAAAVVAVVVISKKASPATAALLLVAVGAAVLLLGDASAWADDGGISECGGIDNWVGCDGTGELAGQAVIGGIAGALGAVTGELVGEGVDEGFDDGSGGGGGPDDDDDDDGEEDGGGGMCGLPDDEELDAEAAEWLDAHPGADLDDFIAARTAASTAAAKQRIAENDAALAAIERDIKRIDERLADMDQNLRTPVKSWADMTNKEKGDARKHLTQAWRQANPKGDPAQLTAMLNRLDLDPSLTPVDMMTYVVGETILGLPGGVYRAGQKTVRDITGGGSMKELVANTAANYWDDVVTGRAAMNIDKLSQTVVGGIMNASDYYGSQSASQILADYGTVMKASGQTAQKYTVAQVEATKKLLVKLEQAAVTGDAPAIAKVLDDAAGQQLFDFMLDAAGGKAVKVVDGSFKALVTKADDLADYAKVRMAKKLPVDIRTAPHGTPVDTAEKARLLGHTQTEMKALQSIADENDVIIRTRPGTEDRLRLLEAGGIGKPEHIKSKSINAADVELGFRQDDVGRIGHLTDDMYARLKAMDPSSLSEAGQKRLQQRLTEYVDRVGDLKKLEKGVSLRVPDPNKPGKLMTTKFQAAPDANGVMRTPDGKAFNGDLDIGDITHADGRPFFVDHDGNPLTGAALRRDRELMVKVQHQLREKAGTLHGGGYWDPKPVIKKGKDGIPTVDCANIRINEAISKEAGPGGKALVEFTPGGTNPTTAYGTGKPRKKYTGYKPWEAQKVDPATGKKSALKPAGSTKPATKPAATKPATAKPAAAKPAAKPTTKPRTK